ncbi:hypothetical protein ACOMHN_058152 [Nucella lapillus]
MKFPFDRFLLERSATFYKTSERELEQLAQHPNGAYQLIQFFSHNWTPLVNTRPGINNSATTPTTTTPQPSLATYDDYQGALSSLIRLQHVYRLTAADMYTGNYLGHEGPALRPSDAFLLGRRAYMDGLLPECIQWLRLCRTVLSGEKGGSVPATFNVFGVMVSESVTLSLATALLGRAYIYVSHC